MDQLLKNRHEAGKKLAKKLIKYKNTADTIVIAIPRGGVPVAYEIALSLELPLEIIIVRKLVLPGQEEYAIGAITLDNVSFLNPVVSDKIKLTDTEIQRVIKQEQQELLRRNTMYRSGRPMPDINGKTIILVDDGIATGSSITVAVLALKRLNPKAIILAIPVLPKNTLRNLGLIAEKEVFLFTPEPFGGVSRWYEDFPQASDDEVINLCNMANQRVLG
jgi:putative phosphoribosyl transferase